MAKRFVGLDVGFGTLRGAQVNMSTRGKPILEKVHEYVLPEGVIDFGEIRDRAAFIEILRRFWSDAGFTTRKVALAAGSLHVFAREFTVPAMSSQRIRESLPFMMEGVLPIATDQLFLDFYPTEEHVDDSGPTIRGLALAAERASVDALVDCAIAARLHPVAVDFIPFALLRVCIDPQSPEGIIALVDVGAGATNILIARGAVPLFVRVIPNGGQDIDRALMFHLKMTKDQAAETKLKLKEAPDTKDKEKAEAWAVMQEAIKDFVGGIKNTVDYFEQEHPATNERVTRAEISGGGSRLAGLRGVLEAQLRVPVTLNGDVRNIEKSKDLSLTKQKLSQMAIAIGLAMGVNS